MLCVHRFQCRFIREEADNAPGGWEVDVARKYYAKLFREYCIADLSRYKVTSIILLVAPPLQAPHPGSTALALHSMPRSIVLHGLDPSAQDGKVGLRWRTEKEVVAGKGQFVCGARGCDARHGLASFEVCNVIPTSIIRVHITLHCADTSTTPSADKLIGNDITLRCS